MSNVQQKIQELEQRIAKLEAISARNLLGKGTFADVFNAIEQERHRDTVCGHSALHRQ